MTKLNKLAHDKRLNKIMLNYGQDHQLDKAQEELQELIYAIDEYKKCQQADKGGVQFSHMAEAIRHMEEETADVYVMLAQISKFFEFKQLNKVIDFKLDRQIKRMEEEK